MTAAATAAAAGVTPDLGIRKRFSRGRSNRRRDRQAGRRQQPQQTERSIRMKLSLRSGLAIAAVAGLVVVGAAGAVVSRSTVGPSNSSPPSISGAATVGNTVTANPGTWTGSTPITFQYQWQICDGNGAGCHAITGATTQTYKFTSADIGNTARVVVIASNTDGSSSSTSVPTAKVVAATASGPA